MALKDTFKNVGEKANEIFEVQKLSMKESSLKRDMEAEYCKIGQYFYEHTESCDGLDEAVAAAFEKIKVLQRDIDINKERIADIKSAWDEERDAKKAAKAESEDEGCCCCCGDCTVCEDAE